MIALLLLGACVSAPAPEAGPRVYAIAYGRSARFSERAMIGDAPPNVRVPASWMAWVIVDGETVVLVDTGASDPEMLRRFGITDHRPISKGLAELDLKATDVDELILTHPHWDHVGDLADFPTARVWAQQAALDWARQRVSDGQEHGGVRPQDVAALDALGPRLQVLRGDAPVTSKVRVHAAGGHTPGAQWVEVDAAVGTVALASDLAYLYRNVETATPPGGSLDPAADQAAVADMLRRTGSVARVVPGHDPAVFTRLPAVAEGVVEVR